MLDLIHIENFVLARNVSIHLQSGFNVFTGETGAGKTLIINAIRYGMGDPIHKETVVSNEMYPHVQLIFSLQPDQKDVLSDYGIDDTGEIICERWINSAGKSRAKINGVFFAIPEYQRICKEFVTIHGQNSTEDLFSQKKQLQLYDSLFRSSYQSCLNEIKEKRQIFFQLKKELASLEESEKNREQEIDFLSYQIEEINKASIRMGEMESLKKDRDRLSNSQKILSSLQASICLLESEGISEHSGLLSDSNQLTTLLLNIHEFSPELESSYKIAHECETILKDLARDLSNQFMLLENQYNEATLNDIINRIDTIHHLQKKYGASESEILDFKDKAEKNLLMLQSFTETKEATQLKLKEIEDSLFRAVTELSQVRISFKQEFITRIENELGDLSMENARFFIDFTHEADDGPMGIAINGKTVRLFETGIDCIEYKIQTNPGLPALPVTQIASGGELSRIMLAIKVIAGSQDPTPTLLFDEVDAGIGGNTGNTIGEKLKQLGKERQIICITHLPQIASKAENHFCIEKTSNKASTEISLTMLTHEERIMEISRMLSGNQSSNTSLSHARELMEK